MSETMISDNSKQMLKTHSHVVQIGLKLQNTGEWRKDATQLNNTLQQSIRYIGSF